MKEAIVGRDEAKRLAKDEDMQKRRKAAADPTRLRILYALGERERLTARQLGDELGIDANRLYYHLRILEQAGVIEVVGTQVAGRMAERIYRQVDHGRVIWDPAEPVELATYLASGLEIAKVKAEEVLYEQARRAKAGESLPVVTWGTPSFVTTHDEIVEFARRVDALQKEFRERAQKQPNDRTKLEFTWLVYETRARDTAAASA